MRRSKASDAVDCGVGAAAAAAAAFGCDACVADPRVRGAALATGDMPLMSDTSDPSVSRRPAAAVRAAATLDAASFDSSAAPSSSERICSMAARSAGSAVARRSLRRPSPRTPLRSVLPALGGGVCCAFDADLLDSGVAFPSRRFSCDARDLSALPGVPAGDRVDHDFFPVLLLLLLLPPPPPPRRGSTFTVDSVSLRVRRSFAASTLSANDSNE